MNPVGMLLSAMAGAAFGVVTMCLLISGKNADEDMDSMIGSEDGFPDMDEFEKATDPAVQWFKENCNPHQRIIIEMDGVELVSGEMGYPTDIPD